MPRAGTAKRSGLRLPKNEEYLIGLCYGSLRQ